MLLLSADDYLLPGALSHSVNLMDAYPEVGFTFGKVIVINDNCSTRETNTVNNVADKVGWRILTGLEFIELSGARDIVPTPTAVVRTKLQKRLGGYRPELPHSGDMEMWLRFAAHASVGKLESYQAAYRRHSSNMSLDYTAKTWLLDFKQRKAAFDTFFQTCGYVLPNAHQLQNKLFWLLGCDVIGFASAAFNECRMEVSEELSGYALELCPEVKQSLPWMKLVCKRLIGFKTWRVLQPIFNGISQMLTSLKRLVNLVSGYLQPSKIHYPSVTFQTQVVHTEDITTQCHRNNER
jgi:hypothetical protein